MDKSFKVSDGLYEGTTPFSGKKNRHKISNGQTS